MNARLMILGALGLALAGCDRGGPIASAPPPADVPPSGVIDVPPAVQRNLGITFAAVQRRQVESTIRVPGAFELQPLARHEYRITLPGTVQLMVDQYEQVEPGDVLYRFRSAQWPALQQEIILGEQDVDTALAAIDVATERITETERLLSAVRERLATLAAADFRHADLEARATELEAGLPRLRAERRLAETTLANARLRREHALHRASIATGIDEATLSRRVEHDGEHVPAYRAFDWIDVRATESGVVAALAVTDGAFVEPPAVVVSTVDPANVRFRAMALQADLPRLADGAEARIVPPSTPGIDIGDDVAATMKIGLEADPRHRTVTLLAVPRGTRSWIRPGVSAFLEVVVESSGGPALAIPRAAIVQDGIVHVFFRRDPGDAGKVMRVEADMGASDGRWVAINSGIGPGDEVVLQGAYELKLASEQRGATPAGGHFHPDGSFHGDH